LALPRLRLPDRDQGCPNRRLRVVIGSDSANTIATILGLLGNDVSIANDGARAVELAERVRPELILMDVGDLETLLSELKASRADRARGLLDTQP
jgi:CheY-like chemotaxis protein